MNIQQAVKSGKRIRREGWKNWYTTSGDAVIGPHGLSLYAEVESLAADDWEVEGPSATITRQQFWDAYDSFRSRLTPATTNYIAEQRMADLAAHIADELGV